MVMVFYPCHGCNFMSIGDFEQTINTIAYIQFSVFTVEPILNSPFSFAHESWTKKKIYWGGKRDVLPSLNIKLFCTFLRTFVDRLRLSHAIIFEFFRNRYHSITFFYGTFSASTGPHWDREILLEYIKMSLF